MGIESIWLGLVRFDSIHTYWRGMCATIQLNSIGCPLGKDSGWKKGLQCIGIFINHNKRYFDKKGEFFQFISNVQIQARISGRTRWACDRFEISISHCGNGLPSYVAICLLTLIWLHQHVILAQSGSSVEKSDFRQEEHGKSEYS